MRQKPCVRRVEVMLAFGGIECLQNQSCPLCVKPVHIGSAVYCIFISMYSVWSFQINIVCSNNCIILFEYIYIVEIFYYDIILLIYLYISNRNWIFIYLFIYFLDRIQQISQPDKKTLIFMGLLIEVLWWYHGRWWYQNIIQYHAIYICI